MFKNYFLLAVFLVIGTVPASAQFLKFEDMTALIEVADDQEEAEKWLENQGFEVNEDPVVEDDKYTIQYWKEIEGQDYFVNLIANLDLDVYSAALYTYNFKVWKYYEEYLAANDYELVDTKKKKGGIFIRDFEGSDYDVSLGEYPKDDGTTMYKIIISYY